MFGRRYITPMVFIFLCILANLAYAAKSYTEKSVFVINSHDMHTVQAYRIDANQVILQVTATLPANSPLDLAVWPQKELLFATHEGTSIISWVSSKTLAGGGFINTNSPSEFAGIMVDTEKGKIYAAQRGYPYLYVFKWNDAQQTLEPNGVYVLSSIEYMYDIALDETNGRLYVSDGTETIRCYDTTTWAYQSQNSFNIVVGSNPRNAVGITVDSNRRYLYSGDWPEYGGGTHLVRTTLSNHTSIETPDLGVMVVGIDVDKATGLIYCTTTNKDFRVYDSNLTLLNNPPPVIGVGNPGVAGVAVGGYYLIHNFSVTKTDDVSCASPGKVINYNICYDANGFADSNVVIVDLLPAEVNFVSASGGIDTDYNESSRTVTWYLGTLASDAAGDVQLTVTANSQAQQVCYIKNTCEMLGDKFTGCATEKTYICGKHLVVYVDVVNRPADGNGSSWTNSFKELRNALSAVRDGNCPCAEQIWVAKGTYYPTNDANQTGATFAMLDGINMYGHFDGSETSLSQRDLSNPAYEAILSGDIGDNNTCDVWYVVTAANSSLDGFTVKKGSSSGSGIYVGSCQSTIANCIIRDNHGYGIHCETSTHAIITNTLISNNWDSGVYSNYGANITIDRCNIAYNGNGDFPSGIYVVDSPAVVKNSIIHHNNNCGIYISSAQSSDVRNNTIVDNGNYGIYKDYGAPIINSTIIWDNPGGGLVGSTFNNVKYCCIQGGHSGTGNINNDPCFRNEDADDYHLKYNSPCIDTGNPNFVADDNETDIDGENRVIDVNVDMGADEFHYCSGRVDISPASPDGIVNFLDFVVLANAWMTSAGHGNYNDVVDFADDGVIDYEDLDVFCDCWLYATGNYESSFGGEMEMMMQSGEEFVSESSPIPPQSQQDLSASEEMMMEQDEDQQQESMMPDYNLPAIFLTCDTNTPDPNDEVTVWVHSDTPLFAMGMGIYVIGDANITTAMSEADCDQFGWDNGWNSDPYIDPNGYVFISGVRWDADANGTVSYIKFRYHSGQVSVYIDQEYSIAFSWDGGSCPIVPLSQEALLIGRDPNDP